MMISIEIPVIRGGWLIQCIDSVLQQTSSNWTLSIHWDGGDDLAREILAAVAEVKHPRIQVTFGERIGIARARQLLTERSRGDLILPLDDDDLLETTAVATFLSAAIERPWAGILRARRGFIDADGQPVEMQDWFPFERRHYFYGATLDIANHAQPYAIQRDIFLATGGWRGFEDSELGEDCYCFAAVEERAEIELLDQVLYRYRIHGSRTSLRFSLPSTNDLWRRIADDAVQRRAAPVIRLDDKPPFHYSRVRSSSPCVDDVDVVVPFWETNEREVQYGPSRPLDFGFSSQRILQGDTHFSQICAFPIKSFNRVELALSGSGPIDGLLSIAFYPTPASFRPRSSCNAGFLPPLNSNSIS